MSILQYAARLDALGIGLMSRFQRMGRMEDLEAGSLPDHTGRGGDTLFRLQITSRLRTRGHDLPRAKWNMPIFHRGLLWFEWHTVTSSEIVT